MAGITMATVRDKTRTSTVVVLEPIGTTETYIRPRRVARSVWSISAKRLLDVAGSLAALLLFSPIILLAALAIFIDSGWPVIFSQRRVGRDGKLFTLYKFRSMTTDAETRLPEVLANNHITDGPTFKWKNDPRITRVGRILRKTSLDELPQLFNVLLGDMSLVGPRPPLESEVKKYEPWQHMRLAVKPGITGLWQVSGRSDLGFVEMVMLDVYYIETWSLLGDLVLLLRTPFAVVTARGAY
jgi:exopolysaccharide biosynthesis polyprenyl glycosylphosphotransferase